MQSQAKSSMPLTPASTLIAPKSNLQSSSKTTDKSEKLQPKQDSAAKEKSENKELPVLLQLAQIDEKKLEDILQHCAKEVSPDIQCAASSLLRFDCSQLLGTQFFLDIYKNNLAASKDEVEDFKLLGCREDHFLQARVSLLLEYLVGLKKSDNPKSKSSESLLRQKILMECVKREILIMLEVYRINSLDAFIKYNEPSRQQESYKILSMEIAKRIFHLTNGHEYVLEAGWFDGNNYGHSFYITFIRHQNDIFIKIDNFGDDENMQYPCNHRNFPSAQLHMIFEQNGSRLVLPSYIGKISTSEINLLNDYILRHISSDKTNAEDCIKKAYDFGSILPHPGDLLPTNFPVPEQEIDNCVIYNYTAGMKARLRRHLSQDEIDKIFKLEKELLANIPSKNPVNLEIYKAKHREVFLKTDYVLDPMIEMLSRLLHNSNYYKFEKMLSEPELYLLSQYFTSKQLEKMKLQLLNSMGYSFTEKSVSESKLYLLDQHFSSKQTKEIEKHSKLQKSYDYIKTITKLNLNNSYLNDNDAIALAKILPHLSGIMELSLAGNQIGDKGAIAIANVSLRVKALKKLDLSHNHIKDDGILALSDVIHDTGLAIINLHNNRYQHSGAFSLAHIQRNCRTKIITFDKVDLKHPGSSLFHDPKSLKRKSSPSPDVEPALKPKKRLKASPATSS